MEQITPELIINILGTLVTIFFSYLMWKNAEKSTKISKKLSEIESNKEFLEKYKIAAEIIQVMKYNFNIVLKNYNTCIYSELNNRKLEEFIMLDNYLEKISLLGGSINFKQIEKIFIIFNKLKNVKEKYNCYDKTIKDFEKNIYNYQIELEEILEIIFKKELIFYSKFFEFIDIMIFLNYEYFKIIKQIELQFLTKTEKEKRMLIKEKYTNFKIEYLDKRRYEEIENYFIGLYDEKGEIIKYTLNLPFENNSELEKVCDIVIDNNKNKNGYILLYEDRNIFSKKERKKVYEGYIKDDKYHGIGKLYNYNNNGFVQGDFEAGKIKNGEEKKYRSGIEYFKGEYNIGEPWNGEIKIKGKAVKIDEWTLDFEGKIKNGKIEEGIGWEIKEIETDSNEIEDICELEYMRYRHIKSLAEIKRDSEEEREEDEIPYEIMKSIRTEEEEERIKKENRFYSIKVKIEFKDGIKKTTNEEKLDSI